MLIVLSPPCAAQTPPPVPTGGPSAGSSSSVVNAVSAVNAVNAGGPINATLAQALTELARERASAAWGSQPLRRIVVNLGRLDPQLQLGPCARIEPFAPAGVPPFGASRVGLRCADSPGAWRVTLPVVVQVFAPGLVSTSGLAAGQVLDASQLSSAEVDAAAKPDPAADPVLADLAMAVGRSLARPLAAGQALRRSHLRQRQWFAAGDPVRIVSGGPGWSVSAEGHAVVAGFEGQPARARTEAGQFVTGWAVADHVLEVRP